MAASPHPSQDRGFANSVLFLPCRRTSSATMKEGSMTELENRAEGSGAQPSPAETDKPEVNLQT